MSDTPVPSEVYLDTSLIVAALHPGTPNAAACTAYVQELAQHRTEVYFSQALRLDLGRAFRRLATKPNNLPRAERKAFELDRWGVDLQVRQRWLIREMRLLDEFLAQFANVVELLMTTATWRQSLHVMASEGLDATDAFHIAAARSAGIADFVTTDRDSRRIASPRIHLIRDANEEAR